MSPLEIIAIVEAAVPILAGLGIIVSGRTFTRKLGVKIGKFTHSISNAHVYDIHEKVAKELIKRKNNHSEVLLKAEKDWFDRGSKGDKKLVYEIVEKLEKQYRPSPPIKGLKIVL